MNLAYRPKLVRCATTSLYSYSGSTALRLRGQFDTRVKLNGAAKQACFLVAKGGSGNLLGFNTAREIRLFQTDMFSSTISCSETIKIAPEHLSKRYESFFCGKIGKLKNYKVFLNVDKSVRPVQLPPRKPPYHVTQCIEKALNTQIAEGVIKKAEGPINWLMPCVPVVKDADSMQIRLTTDSRTLNHAIIREK